MPRTAAEAKAMRAERHEQRRRRSIGKVLDALDERKPKTARARKIVDAQRARVELELERLDNPRPAVVGLVDGAERRWRGPRRQRAQSPTGKT
jgi:hypothetical protein